MGVLNVTPDSFSDGGRHFDPDQATVAAWAMIAAGADLIDVGGESTRPGAVAVTPEEEQRRILPVIAALRGAGVPISVDTRHAATMAAAVGAGAAVVNDVSGLRHDPDALGTVARLGCSVVLMHSRGTPETMDGLARYGDVAAEVTQELAATLDRALAAGIPRDRIAVDPGLGFAKTAEQSLELLRRLPVLLGLGCRVVAGASRKRFIGHLTGEADPLRRGAGSLAAHLFALSRGATVLRTHDVADTVQAVRVWQALAG
jgi:dihydropteroate synthase